AAGAARRTVQPGALQPATRARVDRQCRRHRRSLPRVAERVGGGMPVAVHLPKVGMTMEEGILVRWLLPEGATVNRGDPLFEMETEKVEIEVEADGEGTLRQLVAEGTTLKPG